MQQTHDSASLAFFQDVIENQGNFSWVEYAIRHPTLNAEAKDERHRAKAVAAKWKRYAIASGLPIQLKREDVEPRTKYPPPDKLKEFQAFEIRNFKTGKDGEIISTSYGKEPDPAPEIDYTKTEFAGATINPYGKPWIKVLPKKNQLTPDEIRSLVQEIALTDFHKKDWQPKERQGNLHVISIGDIHIGMDSTDNVFAHTWNKDKAFSRIKQVVEHVDKAAAKVLLIIGGDLNDGQDGKTTRKGHDLPQNLKSREQIKASTDFCLAILDAITDCTDSPVDVVFLSDSNHGGGVMDFAVGLVLQHCAPHRYSGQVNFTLEERFIATYKAGDLDFIISHGYDEKFMPRGLPRFLNKDHVTFFERVIEHNGLTNPVLWRYDQHQHHVIEYPKFKDVMTKAYSSPSSWVSLNFAANDPGGFVSAIVKGASLSVESVNFVD